MPTTERIILDPPEITSIRTEFDLTEFIDNEGIDWGSAEIETFMADKDRGSVPVDFRVPNRSISCGLRLVTRGTVTGQQARAKLQAKVGLFQKEGGWLKRVTNSGGTVFADIIDASLTATSVAGFESEADVDLDAHLELKLLPDFYEAEQTLADNTETTLPELIFTETSVDGDYPARCRIVVDEDDAENQRGLIWGLRNRHYSSATTAALAYQAESLDPLDIAAVRALSGASGGTVVRHGTISSSWTPILSTNIGGTAYMTHTGSYRVWGRCYSTSGTTVQARAVWDVNDLVNPVENEARRLPGASNFYDIDFGEVRLDASPVGTHRWQGQIQARGDVGTENFSIDRLWLQPIDEGAGKLTVPINTTMGAAIYSARSEFNTESGTITGDALVVGGTWIGAGDANDFTVTGGIATRTAVSDTATTTGNGRLITASTPTLTAMMSRVDFKRNVTTINNLSQGLVCRYVDSDTYVTVRIFGSGSALRAMYRNGAGDVLLAGNSTANFSRIPADTYYTVWFWADTSGQYAVWLAPQGGSPGNALCAGQDSVLATGGVVASGKAGVFDWAPDATACTRTYDNFAAWAPTPDAVNFGSQSLQLTTDGNYRLDVGGTAYGPVSIQSGDLPRLPVSGMEGRTTQVFLKSSRGDFGDLPDGGIDDISARVYYQASWLHVPE